ncbi:hypothetical protein [Rhodoferax sp.]|uniref:hypothetical protein n=1 Tax=Rhodoferax sp. TaxID=50421 RepID=UPI002ACE1C17|nr:hypothetical protein [Rhodoferax sp.]MDZ7920214.1 hypothetical protein [Rhodoferax sp.]
MKDIEFRKPIEAAWVDHLLVEARRDLVFLWHIIQGKFGGRIIPAAELPSTLERIVESLLEKGCTVGFGNPDSPEWTLNSGPRLLMRKYRLTASLLPKSAVP